MTDDNRKLAPPGTIQADFDRIALLSQESWNHNDHYHTFLLRAIPPCQAALEIGCGAGAFSRLLARRADHVLALDLSPQMIRLAQERSKAFPNIDFQVADFSARPLPAETYDCVATIATLHHLPLGASLSKLRQTLKAGGVLAALDLFAGQGLGDWLTSAAALPADLVVRLMKNGRLRASPAERAAWDEHGRHERYLTLAQVRSICAQVLPGAQVRKHLFWRYSLIWRKPAA
jgi:SAM-dependent methyltransferase